MTHTAVSFTNLPGSSVGGEVEVAPLRLMGIVAVAMVTDQYAEIHIIRSNIS